MYLYPDGCAKGWCVSVVEAQPLRTFHLPIWDQLFSGKPRPTQEPAQPPPDKWFAEYAPENADRYYVTGQAYGPTAEEAAARAIEDFKQYMDAMYEQAFGPTPDL